VEQVYVIRHKRVVEGVAVRQIAREMGISRNTVRKYLGQAEPMRQVRPRKRRPVFEQVGPPLEQLVAEWTPRTTPEQRLTAARLHRAHAGEIDEELLAGAVLLAHDDIELAPPVSVQIAETGVAIALLAMLLVVLLPEQLQGHAAALQLPVDPLKVGRRPIASPRRWRVQAGLQRGVIKIVWQRPAQASGRRTGHHPVDRARPDAAAPRRVPQRASLSPSEPKYFPRVAHR
jgi:transposase-like protein